LGGTQVNPKTTGPGELRAATATGAQKMSVGPGDVLNIPAGVSHQFLLAPGNYHLKFVIRENQTGRMGSFETDVHIPDLRKSPLKMSSVVLSSLRVPSTGKKAAGNPLVRDQMELVPNITHVFTPDQHLYLQYEVYDPVKGKNAAQVAPASVSTQTEGAKSPEPAKSFRDSVRVLTSIEFLQGSTKVYESKPVVANEVTAPDRKAVVFQIDVPLQSLKPGLYLCQVNVIDDVVGSFSFPRFPLLIRAPVTRTTSQAVAASATPE